MGHGGARVCTALACFGASLAVGHVVLATLRGAAPARVGAQRTDGQHVFTASGHGGGCKPAEVGTFQIQRDAVRHGFGVGLLEPRSMGAVWLCVSARGRQQRKGRHARAE
jgi:hypothetical protein